MDVLISIRLNQWMPILDVLVRGPITLFQLAYEVYLQRLGSGFPSFSPTHPFSFSQGSMAIIGSCIFKPGSFWYNQPRNTKMFA